MARLERFFPKSHGKRSIYARRRVSTIVSRIGSRWHRSAGHYSPQKTIYNRWSDKGIFARKIDGLAAKAVVPKTEMVDATFLKQLRTATDLRSKKGAPATKVGT